jgi:hypothetical protein
MIAQIAFFAIKWTASDIPRGFATGLESEYNEKKHTLH